MIILSKRRGLVKVTTHAQNRLTKRFNVSKRSIYRIMKRILEMGVQEEHIMDDQVYFTHGSYTAVCTLTESGHLIIVTILNKDSK